MITFYTGYNTCCVILLCRTISADPIDDEDGDFKCKDDRDHRTVAEQEKMRIAWNIERRCFMDSNGTKS